MPSVPPPPGVPPSPGESFPAGESLVAAEPEPPAAAPRPVVTPRRLVAAVAVVALVALAVSVATAPDDDPPAGGPATVPPVDADAADAFVAAWRRSLKGTFAVTSAFERQTRGGGTFSSETVTVQRPPDRVATGAGSVDARIGGRQLACATDPDGVLRCRDGGPAPPYDEFVDRRVDRVAELVRGDEPLYAVERAEGGCYRLRLRAALPAPPYGLLARFCFDARTGAPASSEIRREHSVDRTTAIRLDPTVSDDDLRLPDGVEMGERRGS